MLGTRWIGFTRRNQVKIIPIQKLWTAIINCGPKSDTCMIWLVLLSLLVVSTIIIDFAGFVLLCCVYLIFAMSDLYWL
jgi:hypothetical protein